MLALLITVLLVAIIKQPIVILYRTETHQFYVNSNLLIGIIFAIYFCYLLYTNDNQD